MAGGMTDIIMHILMGGGSDGIALNDPRTDRTTPYTGPNETPADPQMLEALLKRMSGGSDLPPSTTAIPQAAPQEYWDPGIPGVLSAPPRWRR